jgi:hypothetical protein
MWGLDFALMQGLTTFADTSSAITSMRDYVMPLVQILSGLGGLASVFFIIQAGYLYMTSSGKPDQMEHAKDILKKALLGLIIILAAITLTTVLTSAYGTPNSPANATLPSLEAVAEEEQSNGFLDMVVKAITGVLSQIVNAIATPFLNALDFFTTSTPSMASNPTVFNFWLAMVGIGNILFILVLVLIGFHVMSASALGFDEVEPKHLVPRVIMIFALMNSSIFLIDGIIALSNALIVAVGLISGSSSVWDTLMKVVEQTSGLGIAALLIMVAFVICAVVLLVYYVMRLVTLYIGAVLAPLVSLMWLIPGFRDFAETAFKTYLSTIFVLFVHVIILQLAASLFTGMATASGEDAVPDTLMAMVTGIATILLLLKAQGVMMQFSYVSMGSRNMRKLGGQFINGVSYMTGKTKAAAGVVGSKASSAKNAHKMKSIESRAVRTGKPQTIRYQNKQGSTVTHTATPPTSRPSAKTGATYEVPQVKVTRVNHPSNNAKDKTS